MEEGQRLLERILDGVEDPTDLPFALLQHITDNFSQERKIGQGGFGEVYKGVLGERFVAVKRIYINENTVDGRLFRCEFASLWNTNHQNVVRILGVCSQVHHKPMREDGSGELIWASVLERLLCFEYIINGSLDMHITDELRGFEWETRYEIIIGICKGLRYLHEEKKIIHMDLKPANILLHNQQEKYMVPKITDFGLSRLNEKSYTVGKRYGTRGYMAPEYDEYGETTTACDIYSLGAIIIELVTGSMEVPNNENVFRRWRHRWNKPPTQLQYQQVTKCINIAERCRGQKPYARPSILEVILYLRESESTYGQIAPCFHKDDMLRIKPLKLRVPSELKNEISRSLELTNGTFNCIAFTIQLPSAQYNAQPVKGVVQPGSMSFVTITVQSRDVREHDHADKFVVQSTKETEGLRDEDIIERMFHAEADKVVDEVAVMVVYEATKPEENCKHREDTTMPADEFPEAKKRKIVDSAFRKGKNKIGIDENAEEAPMDINSGEEGQCAERTEQCKWLPLQCFSRHYPTYTKYLGKGSPAVDRARGAMGSLLDKLGKLVTQEYSLDTSMKKDIESFSEDLKNIHQELPKLENVDGAEDFIDEVREITYSIEDMIDSFLVRVEPNNNGIGFRELTHQGLKLWENGMIIHQQVGDVIRDIKNQVQVVVERKNKYNFNVNKFVANVTDKDAIEDLRNSAINIGIEQLIGIETPINEIIDLFENDGNISTQNLKVVSIVGLGGLGKTTLAKAVYENLSKAKNYTRAFIAVGQNPVMKEVLKNIISAFESGFSAENLQLCQLCEKLKNILKNKRYFIFIDDIWDCSDWERIRHAFPENKCGSRVITTTRNYDVALACCYPENKYVYWIKPLSKEDSKKLFFRRTCRPEKDCPDALKDISVAILKACGGMPLAINSIASLLRGKEHTTWEYVGKSLGALTEGKTGCESMKQILDLSYIHLPDHLKTCLLYVCMYPEDREIDKKDLLMQWVAEGFVHVSTNSRLDVEDVAEDYFQKLISMCMIQPGKIDYNNEVLSCRVHDIILDLMKSKSSELNFIQVIDGFKDVSVTRGEIRRALVRNNDNENITIPKTIRVLLSRARSVFLYGALLLPDFLKCNHVRVLHLQVNYTGLDLTSISRFFLLRYLHISYIYQSGELKLPDQIGQLQQLETIVLVGVELENYPSDIVTLPCLSHVRYDHPYAGIALPSGIGRLKSLHTLEGIWVEQSSVEAIQGLGELTNLRNLGIFSNTGYLEEVEMSARMNALQSSILRLSTSLRIFTMDFVFSGVKLDESSWSRTLFPEGSHIGKIHVSGCIFERCPEWIGQLRDLYSLSIEVTEVADSVSIAARLPSLAYFRLEIDRDKQGKEESVVMSGQGAFQALRHLHFYCQNASLTFQEGALPKLEKLDILFPFNMIRRPLPVGIQHLPACTLKKIILRMNASWGCEHDWNPRGSEHWNNHDWENERKSRTLLKRAFKSHHPSADIVVTRMEAYADYYRDPKSVDYEEDNQEQNEDGYDDEDFCMEDYYSSQAPPGGLVDHSEAVINGELRDELNGGSCYYIEDDEAVYQENGSRSSAQVQSSTKQLLPLIEEAKQDSGGMSITADACVMVDTLLHLAVGSEEGRQSVHSQDLDISESVQLPFPSWLAPWTSCLDLTLAPCSSPDRAPPGGLTDLIQAPNQLNHEDFPELERS